MSRLTIGKLKLETAVREDLDGRTAAALGLSPCEVLRLLEGHCIAGIVAKAAAPLLVESPPRTDLTAAIAKAGVNTIRKRVHRLYVAACHPKKGSDAKAEV